MENKDEPWYFFKQHPDPIKEDDEKRKQAEKRKRLEGLPKAPKWRQFKGRDARRYRGEKFEAGPREVEMVNAALYLRRPLLITGNPGTGKSSLAYAVQHQLGLDSVLYWPITTRTTLQDGLYTYDAIGRLQETERFGEKPGNIGGDKDTHASQIREKERSGGKPDGDGSSNKRDPKDIGRYITLGPLGTALLPAEYPRVLLIDEIDKSDIDLPNDLLNVFEEGGFSLKELKRLADRETPVTVMTCDDRTADITGGEVVCDEFPFVVLTSNRERELPAPFLRRCLRLDIDDPDDKKLVRIVEAHFEEEVPEIRDQMQKLIDYMMDQRGEDRLVSTDQLLNAIYLAAQGIEVTGKDQEQLLKELMRDLNETERS